MGSRKHHARLVEDGGKLAVEPEFFRSSDFMAAESVTHTLVIEAGGSVLRAPLKVNPIKGGGKDAVSPYGYPGLGGDARLRVATEEIDFSATGLVAIFMRHRLDEVPFHVTTDNNVVYIADPSAERYSRPQDRHQVQRNSDKGFNTYIIHGPDCSETDQVDFIRVYTETMERRQAPNRYFFSDSYIGRVLSSPLSHLAVTWDSEGEVVAASIVVFSDGFMHYFLTGSAEARHRESPTKNLVTFLVNWSYELGIPLNLGGGLKDDEGKLAMFKRGFSNREESWKTSEVVCDPDAYRELSAGREDADFFPAYRDPNLASRH